jgi:hypothetical protein
MLLRAVLIIALLAPAGASAFDLKGIALDHTYSSDEVIAKLGMPCDGDCSGKTTVGNALASVDISKANDGTVGQIMVFFNAHAFSEIESLLRAKYGAPAQVQHSNMTNNFGAVFHDTAEKWTSKNGQELRLNRYIDAESSSIIMDTAKYRAEGAAYKKAHASGI